MFKRHKRLLGVDIGSHTIKAVLLSSVGRGGVSYELEKIALQPMAQQIIVEGDIIDSVAVIDGLDRLLREMRVRINDVGISLAGDSVIIKKISLPQMSPEELDDSIIWEAEQYIPFEIDEVMVDYHILADAPEGGAMDVVLVAVKKDKINDYTSVISQVGKNTALVDIDLFTLQNCFEVNYPEVEYSNVGLVNIGASVTSINILEEGVTSFWRDVMTGGNRHTEALQRSFGLGIEQAEDAKRGFEVEGAPPESVAQVLTRASEEIVDLISKTFDLYFGGTEAGRLDRVFLSGGAANTHSLIDLLGGRLGTEVEIMDPFHSIAINPKKFDLEYIQDQAVNFAVAVGLAAREVDD